MMKTQPTLEAIKYRRGELALLDQKRLPQEFVYDACTNSEDAYDAIHVSIVSVESNLYSACSIIQILIYQQ